MIEPGVGSEAGRTRDEFSVAEVLDGVCTDILRAMYRGEPLTTMRVNSALYELIAEAKRRELEWGNPLMILGLELQQSDDVVGNEAKLE